jgi:hypothetical protein
MRRSSSLFVLLLVLALSLLAPAPAFAKATTLTSSFTSEIDAVVANDCLGDTITVKGGLRSVFHYTLDNTGVAHFTAQTNALVRGVGESGTIYVSPGASHVSNITSEGGVPDRIVSTNTFLLVSRGGAANFLFHVTQVFVVNAQGVISADTVASRAECLP